jgi:PiT family inorganic phosphate transporter
MVFVILVAAAGLMFRRARRTSVNAKNVNAEWEGGLVPADAKQQTPMSVGA